MHRMIPLSLLALLLGAACGGSSEPETDSNEASDSDQETGSTADWEELEDDDGSSDKDKGGYYDTGKGGTGSCGSEVKAGASCEGDWEETLCQDEYGNYWWCENGTWTSK